MVIITTIMITLIIGSIIVSFCQIYLPKSYKNEAGGQGVYVYSEKEFYRVLETAGYPISWRSRSSLGYGYHVSRNSAGTELRCVHPTKHKALILSCDGSIQEITVPGYPVWLNDAQEVVAWRQHGRIHYTYGQHSEPINRAFRLGEEPDPAGKFFIKTLSSERTDIYSTEQPHQSLATIPSLCGWDGIFFKDNTIFLFGNPCDDEQKSNGNEFHVLQVDGENLREREVVGISQPESSDADDYFVVKDFSPWSDEVLLLNLYDFSERSVYFVVNFQTHEMKELGREPWSNVGGFFLHCDILQEVTKKLAGRRGSE
ncbi:MAG: hypothetical protein GY792_19415 [Gammaproteobacteria bacterium]|nr:hypothetical protein [Gammaproteobacteria bacterium]